MSNFYYMWASLGSILPIVICVGCVVCCVALCCFCCKKSNQQRHQNVTTVVYSHPSPQQLPISEYQPPYPAYQPVPLHTHAGLPDASAPPPSYLEATNPALSHNNPVPPMFLHSSQPSGHSDVHQQLPYNPAFCPGIASQ